MAQGSPYGETAIFMSRRHPSPRAFRLAAAAVCVGALAMMAQAARAGSALDDVVLNDVCDDVAAGSALAAQCAVFDLDSPTRSAAASGNNLGITGAQGRSKIKVRDRLEGQQQTEVEGQSGGSAADWHVGKLGLFISGDATLADRDATANESGNDTTTLGLTLGADWRFSPAFIAGLAFTYSNGDTDFDAGAGDLDTQSYGGLLYASFAPNAIIYIDAYAGYAVQDYDGTRNIAFVAGGTPVAASANSDTSGDEWTFGASIAADFGLGGWTLGPHAQIDYSRTEVDAYSESGGAGFAIAFGDQTIKSLQSVLGAHASYAISTGWGVVVPYGRLDWVHEFEDDSRSVPASFVQATAVPFVVLTDEADRDFGRLSVGASALWPGGWAAFADYQYQFAHSFLTEHKFTVGLRKEF